MEQLGAFLPLILIFGVFYILLIRPQQKKIKLHREMINNLRRGDKVVTNGGIIATITKVSDNRELFLEISENVEIKLAPGMITDLYVTSEKKEKTELNKKIETKNNNMFSSLFKKKDK
mgnify:CR=1 FL=1|tara:strand:- start:2436 stop:2789 length:354 start_codon:yes stop_codon:yes gene_type:complete